MEDNPYQPPPDAAGDADVGKSSTNRGRMVIVILLVASVATPLTFVLPLVAVPAALLLLPAGLRILKVQAVRNARHLDSAARDRLTLIAGSLLAAIPIGAASLILFCCVCTPVGLLAATIESQQYGPTELGLAIAVFLGLLAGLFFGTFLLRRLGFFSVEVKNATRKT